MKKKTLGILLLLFFVLPFAAQAEEVEAPRKQCHAYVVMDAGSGEVLFGQNANKKLYPASTAKLMTAIVCVEQGDTDSSIKTKSDIVYHTTPGTYSLGIGAGVTYTFKDLLHMSLMSSAADATDSLAAGVFGSKKACVQAMNEKCEALGLKKTSFDNPVGSDIGAGYKKTYSTATEMAKICRYAMAIPLIRSAVAKAHYETQKGGVYVNTTNWFLKGMAYYDEDKYHIIGSKSGTTNAAGHVFIATATDDDGHEVICAYFGNVSKESTFASIRSLFDYTFSQYDKGKLTLTSSNYDVRSSEKYSAAYDEFATLHCYPSGKNGKYEPDKAITGAELASFLKKADALEEETALASLLKEKKDDTVTMLAFAELLQAIYPNHLKTERQEELLSACKGLDQASDEERAAFASFVASGLAVDEGCKDAKGKLTRGQALLIADALTDYQMRYTASHITAENRTMVSKYKLAMPVITFNKQWSQSLSAQHEERLAEERAAEKAAKKEAEKEAKKKAAEAEKQKEEEAKTEGKKEKEKKTTEKTKDTK